MLAKRCDGSSSTSPTVALAACRRRAVRRSAGRGRARAPLRSGRASASSTWGTRSRNSSALPDRSDSGTSPSSSHVGQLEVEPHLARQDDQLARDVGAREIVARIRLGESLRLGLAHQRRERLLAVPDVEEVRQRAREDPFDPLDAIAGLAQIAQRLDDRQSGADRGLVKVVRRLRRRRASAERRGRTPRSALPACLFGVTTWMPGREPSGIVPRDRGAGRAVDDHRVREVAGVDVLHELPPGRSGRRSSSASRQCVIGTAVSARVIFFDVRMPRSRRSRLEVVGEPAHLRRELIEEHAADRSRPDQPDRDGVRRQVEAGVHRAERARGLLAVDDHRDVALGRALRDRADVDAGGAERVEQLGGDARRAGHAVADDGEDAAVAGDVDPLDLSLPQLALERLAHDRCGALRLRLFQREADRMLGAALRDQRDRDAVLAQRAEQPLRRPRARRSCRCLRR